MRSFYLFTKSVAITACATAALLVSPSLVERVAEQADVAISLKASVSAQAEKQKATRRLPGISEKIFKGLGKVSNYASPPEEELAKGVKPDFNAAYKELKKLEKSCIDSCNGYEMSQIYNMFAFVAYSLEKYDEAVGFYIKVVEQSPQIPIGVELQSMMYIAQLSFQLDKLQQSINYLDRWIALATETGNAIGPEIYQLKAVICYQDDKKTCAFDNITKAIDLVEARGKVAEEGWYNLQRSIYIEREAFAPATVVLEKMLRHYPKKSYWAQLGSMYGMLERGNDQLHAMEASYLMGAYSKEKDLVNLAYLYLAEEVPYRSAVILEKGMKDGLIEESSKNLQVLATAWQNSKESKKAIPVLREAGKNADTGNVYAQLAAVYLDLNEPKKAIEAGKLALNKGNFKRSVDGEVHMNMGIAYFDLKQYSNAIKSFENASKIKKHRKFALSWLNYAKNEKKRYEGLKASLASVGVDIDKLL